VTGRRAVSGRALAPAPISASFRPDGR
jgi:hypothetical protein